jgi:hypothetical protein
VAHGVKVPAVVPVSWQGAAAALAMPFFDGVRPLLRELDGPDWPSLDQLNVLAIRQQIVNALGRPIRFVAPPAEAVSAMRYETQIDATGEVPTRDNWHDLFNALQWIAFPHLKSAINLQHARLLAAGGAAEASARSAPRDVLTMFDESGIIVASADASLLELMRAFRWRELFVERRADVIANMRFVLVGHGLLEKSLAPFVGMTAKAMLLNVDAQLPGLDQAAADWLGNEGNLADSHNLAPLPLLGIPGWDRRNESPDFYENTHYFRPGRRGLREGA